VGESAWVIAAVIFALFIVLLFFDKP